MTAAATSIVAVAVAAAAVAVAAIGDAPAGIDDGVTTPRVPPMPSDLARLDGVDGVHDERGRARSDEGSGVVEPLRLPLQLGEQRVSAKQLVAQLALLHEHLAQLLLLVLAQLDARRLLELERAQLGLELRHHPGRRRRLLRSLHLRPEQPRLLRSTPCPHALLRLLTAHPLVGRA